VKLDQPAWLILLILIPLLGTGALFAARLRRKQWTSFVAPRLRGRLLKRGNPLPRWFALSFLLAAGAACIIALARPQGDLGTRTEKTLGRNVLIALDLSRSMRVADVKPDRLSQAKMVIYELLDALPNERIGVIGFAGSAYVYAPLTVDHGAVRETVEQIDETWAPRGGSDLSSALELAIDTLKKNRQKNNALVILSDGEKHKGELDEMITEAARSGVYILAIGVGTEDGDFVPNSDFPENRMIGKNGKPVISRLQPETMRKLAIETNGRYALAGSGMDIPAMINAAIQDLDAFELDGRERHIAIEFYQWLVLPAILFLMASILAATRWRGINATTAMLACLILSSQNTRADATSSAKQALKNGHYQEALGAYQNLAKNSRSKTRAARFRLGEGTAAYRVEDFKHARSAFSNALLSDHPKVIASAHLGMANTLFQLGWRSLAQESYPAPPAQLPTPEEFDTLVRDTLTELRDDSDPESSTARGYSQIKTIVKNWADSVRHYESCLSARPSDPSAENNKLMTIAYLKRLMRLLEEDRQQTEQALPEPQDQPGEGKPEDEEGDGPPKNPENGDEGPENPGDDGKNDEDPKDNSEGSDKEPEKPEDKPDEDGKPAEDPDETPEERARRILKENADLEKGPLTPGRRELQTPEKDW